MIQDELKAGVSLAILALLMIALFVFLLLADHIFGIR